jgi:integrase
MSTVNRLAQTYQEEAFPFRMPIEPADYPDRTPALTEEERKGIADLLSLPSARYLEFERQANVLSRVTQPLMDVLALFQQRRPESRVFRHLFIKYLLSQVLQTNTLYWGWPGSIWASVIDSLPKRSRSAAQSREANDTTRSSPHYVLLHLAAYLFSGRLQSPGKRGFPAHMMGEILFGPEVLQTAIDTVLGARAARGYTEIHKGKTAFVFVLILVLLVNHNPSLGALTPASLSELCQTEMGGKERGRIEQLRSVLMSLGIIPEERYLAEEKLPPQLFQDASVMDVHPRWVAWLRAFWRQTPISRNNRKDIVGPMLMACRWLAHRHPHITEPGQWTRELAVEYVAYVCNEATVFDYASPDRRQLFANHLQQKQGEPLKATGIRKRIDSVRSFFRCLQKYSYEVNGRLEPRLEINWNPADALALPTYVRAQLQPNPRNIEEEAWLKLVWTACTLNAEMVQDAAPGAKMYPLPMVRALALVWVTGCRRSDEIRRLPLECLRNEWAPEMVDEHGVQLEPAEHLWYIRVPTNKYRGEFWSPIPQYTAEAIVAWQAIRPKNQPLVQDRKTRKPTAYLFQYREKLIGTGFLNDSLIPLLCKAAGLTDEQGKPYRDAVGPITSYRARSSTAYYLKAMGMTPYDIGKLLGHTNPNRTLPWYLKENLHQLGRMYRKANPLDRTVHALLDTDAVGRGEPCIFYYLADSAQGRPRMCGNPNFRVCYHQLQCAECAAYIETELAEVIEKRPGVLHISVPIPLPEQLVEDLTKQEEGSPLGEPPSPPPIPSAAFHFNKKMAALIEEGSGQNASELAQLRSRLVDLETQLAAKGKQDARNVSIRLLKQEIGELKKHLAGLERQQEVGGQEKRGDPVQ